MTFKIKNLFGLVVLGGALSAQAQTDLNNLPSAAEWRAHTDLLGKYWLHPDAKGVPVGNFPTWRCNDGSLRNLARCSDETQAPDWIKVAGTFDFVRMQSRQTFAYGALFNLTGNPEYLKLHMAGVEHLLKDARDPDGGFYLFLQNNKPVGEGRLTRTTQDLSYALVGLAMNAYLTHDPKVIETIMETQKYIYSTYYDKKSGLLRWVLEDFAPLNNSKKQLELVAELDQLNAYLLLTWRLVPESQKAEWTKVIKETIDIINKKFYDPKNNRFQGCIDNDTCYDELTGRHMDFGHRVKAFWMEYLAACGFGDNKLKEFAQKGILETLGIAINKEQNEWSEGYTLDPASWWVWAELDQAALTMSLNHKYDMPKTLYTWINERTDHEYGEMKSFMKTNLWANGFHSTEHALIGTLMSNAIRYDACADDTCRKNNTTTLYFAPYDLDSQASSATSASMSAYLLAQKGYTPYLYSGSIDKVAVEGSVVSVTFGKIASPELVK